MRQYRVAPEPSRRCRRSTSRSSRSRAPITPLRHQHRRRLRRPARARVPDPQRRPDQAPRGPAQHWSSPRARARRSCCGRWRRSTSRRASSAATPATMGKPAVIVGIQKQPTPTPSTLTRADRGAARRASRRRCRQGVTANNVQFRQATFIETSIANVRARAARGGARRRRRPVPVPDERPRDR